MCARQSPPTSLPSATRAERPEEILDLLESHGVRTLVDIRQHAVSMYRPELSKSNLAELLDQKGIEYAHLPQLGVPRDIRAKAIDTGSRDVIWSCTTLM